MSRTPLMRALSRRQFLGLGGAAAATALLPYRGNAEHVRVGILGGGAAGLAAAYSLKRQGIPFEIIEASTRMGGRIYTLSNWNQANQFIELGGELLNTTDVETLTLIRKLRAEQNQAIREGRKFTPEDLRFISFKDGEFDPSLIPVMFTANGQIYTLAELEGALKNLLPYIAKIRHDIFGNFNGDYTYHLAKRFPKAAAWDQKPISEFIDSLRGHADSWVLDVLKGTYTAEYGLPAEELSALNFILVIDTDLSDNFTLYGAYDEELRLGGGNSAMIRALVNSLSNYGQKPVDQFLTTGLAVTSISRHGGRYSVQFNNGPERHYTHLIVTMPATQLRKIGGWEQLKVSKPKMDLIQNIAMGQSAKLMMEFSERSWRDRSLVGPRASTGEIYLATTGSVLWETSRMQPGETGIMTYYKAGPLLAMKAVETEAVAEFKNIYGAAAAAKFTGKVTSFNWPRYPLTDGSYSTLKLGQSSRFWGAGSESEGSGTLLFAGEHTSEKSQGFINGGIESGLRAAKQVTRSLSFWTNVE